MAKITILGSGSLPYDLDHYGPAFLVEVEGKKILIDFGVGTMFRLIQLKITPNDLDYIFLTHLHADHTAELFPFLARRVIYTDDPKITTKALTIFGPEDVDEFIQEGFKLFRHNNVYNRLKNTFFKKIGYGFDEDFFQIETFKSKHGDTIVNGYRFKINGKSFVFTGDTTKSQDLIDGLKDADLVFIDCSDSKDFSFPSHMNTVQAGEVCKEANVKKAILCHLSSRSYNKDLVSEVKEIFDGEVILAKDLMEIEI